VTNSAGTTTNAGALNGGVSVTGGMFDNNAGGIVTGATTITGGTANNAGMLAAVDNQAAGTFNNLAGGVAGAVTNAGTGTNAGTINGGLTNTAGTTTNTGTINGGATVDGGTLTTTGTINGGVTNSAIVNAAGIITGTATNNAAGIFNLTGSLSGLTTLNNAGTFNGNNNVFGAIAETLTFNNTGTIAGGFGSIAGMTSFTLNNNAGGTWNITGASTINLNGVTDTINNSSLINVDAMQTITGAEAFNNLATGAIDMADGALGDSLTLAGAAGSAFTSTAGSALMFDINLSLNNPGGVPQLSDQLIVTGSDVTGNTDVTFALLSPVLGLQDEDIIVIDADPAATNSLTIDSVTGLPAPGGLVEYTFLQDAASEDWVVRSALNVAGVGSVAGSLQQSLAVIGTVVNRPSSPFVASPIAPDPDTCAPGIWGRGTGGQAEITASSAITGFPGVSSTTMIGYAGFQGGIDFGCFNIGDNKLDINVGLTGGFNGGNTSTMLPTSVTRTRFESRFVGGYITMVQDRFFADLQARVDYTDFKINNVAIGLANSRVDSERFSLNGSAGYAFSVEEYNLIPSIGFSYSNSSTGLITFADGSTLQLNDHDSFLGFAGATLNRVFVLGNDDDEEEGGDLAAVIPFVTATLYNEFGGDSTAVFTDAATLVQRTVTTENLGLYGEISVGVNYRKVFASENAPAREFSASLRGDMKFGPHVDAYGITAQFRFQF